MRNSVLNGGANNGIGAALRLGFLYLYDGTQPASADTGATGTLLGKVTINNDGVTGLTFDPAANGVMHKAAAENWQFHGLAAGNVGWFRFCEATDVPGNTSSTTKRVDGLVGTAGADANISNTAIVAGAISTVDDWSFTMPPSL
jgi:hypothetical protein